MKRGVLLLTRQSAGRGVGMTSVVNQRGTSPWTQALLPLVKAAPEGRVVTLSSKLHYRGHMQWDDLNYKTRPYKGWEAYNQSKLANVLMTKALARRLQGSGAAAFAVHPGVVATDLGRDYPDWLMSMAKVFMITPEKGARTSIYTATEPGLHKLSGAYFESSKEKKAAAEALLEDNQERLWALSEELTA